MQSRLWSWLLLAAAFVVVADPFVAAVARAVPVVIALAACGLIVLWVSRGR
jgi:hypothetical protein